MSLQLNQVSLNCLMLQLGLVSLIWQRNKQFHSFGDVTEDIILGIMLIYHIVIYAYFIYKISLLLKPHLDCPILQVSSRSSYLSSTISQVCEYKTPQEAS